MKPTTLDGPEGRIRVVFGDRDGRIILDDREKFGKIGPDDRSHFRRLARQLKLLVNFSSPKSGPGCTQWVFARVTLGPALENKKKNGPDLEQLQPRVLDLAVRFFNCLPTLRRRREERRHLRNERKRAKRAERRLRKYGTTAGRMTASALAAQRAAALTDSF